MLSDAIKLLKDGKVDEALVVFDKIVDVEPNNVVALSNAAICYAYRKDFGQAINLTKRALELDANNYMFLSNLSAFYAQLGEFEQSINYIKKCQLVKEGPEDWAKMGLVYWDMKRYEDAEQCFKKALEYDRSNVNMHVNLALLHLINGRFKEGFEEYLWRIDPNSPMEHYLRCYDQRRHWDGKSDISGKRFLVYGEQGLGDVIQFSRYLSDLKSRGATVIFHCPAILADLLKPLADELFTKDIEKCKSADLPEYDYQCCSMSLPHFLKEYNPSGKPYLDFNKNDLSKGIAVVWSGSSDHPGDELRSIPIEDFRKLLETQREFYGLQFGIDSNLSNDLSSSYNFKDVSGSLGSFSETAQFLSQNIRLVITCDTALTHLAGAIGIDTWLLLPANSDWRWGLSDKTVWYDSIRIFRQSSFGDWTQVINKVKEELEGNHD